MPRQPAIAADHTIQRTGDDERDRRLVHAAALTRTAARAKPRAVMDAVSQLIAEAVRSLGPKAVVTDPSEIEPWATDWRGRVHGSARAMLAPASTEEVAAIVELLTMQLGLNSVLVTGEINFRDGLTTDEIERLLTRIAARVREAAPDVRNVYLEPHSLSSAAARRSGVTG